MLELGRTEEVIREMDKLANEDHTHHATEEELNENRSNWWIRSNFVGSDTMLFLVLVAMAKFLVASFI